MYLLHYQARKNEEEKRLFLSKAESISFRQDPLCTLGSDGFWSFYIGYQNRLYFTKQMNVIQGNLSIL